MTTDLSPAKKKRYLDFESPLQELDNQISQLKGLKLQGQVDVSREILALEAKASDFLKSTYESLKPYQVVQLSRHPDRPTALDYIEMMFDEFIPLQGDRAFMDDRALVCGLASLKGRAVAVIGHQKGRSTQENMQRNFGMPKPEGYRKAFRIMKLAERFNLPLITLVDTPGAYPGIEAEERGQAVAIAENIMLMTSLRVPILSVILGEGGSGGALAVAVCDRLLMFQYTTYSVISPEGCASIIWKDAAFASKAAEALKITAQEIQRIGIADEIVPEPLGGAHRDPLSAGGALAVALDKRLSELSQIPIEELIKQRYDRYRKIGAYSK
jgi:acetyl-CoA carboxylase carboxyl transferase subunit alpha